jgi:uncharacterized protein YcbK (DUF882 family)
MMLADIQMFKKSENVQLSRSIWLKDWNCKCNVCRYTLVCMDQVTSLQAVIDHTGLNLRLNSCYRCCAHNFTTPNAEPDSMHLKGIASDVSCKDIPTTELFQILRPLFDGVGKYNTFIHVDKRGFPSFWDKT